MALNLRGRGQTPPRNTDGPGNTPIYYGEPRGKGQDQRWQEAMDRYGASPWYGRPGDANPMPNAGGPSARGKVTPFFTPDPGDPRNAGYYVPDDSGYKPTQHQQDVWASREADWNNRLTSSPEYQAAKAAGDYGGMQDAEVALKGQYAREGFVKQGGRGETWDNRYSNAWPVPKSTSGNYQYGPGRPGPTPPGVAQAQAAPAAATGGVRRGATPGANGPAVPPSQNQMFQGYTPGPSTGTAGLYGDPSLYSSPAMGRGPSPFGSLMGGGGMAALMSLYGLNSGGMNASPFGGGGFGMPSGGGEGFARFGASPLSFAPQMSGMMAPMQQAFRGYQPAMPQGMMYPY